MIIVHYQSNSWKKKEIKNLQENQKFWKANLKWQKEKNLKKQKKKVLKNRKKEKRQLVKEASKN